MKHPVSKAREEILRIAETDMDLKILSVKAVGEINKTNDKKIVQGFINDIEKLETSKSVVKENFPYINDCRKLKCALINLSLLMNYEKELHEVVPVELRVAGYEPLWIQPPILYKPVLIKKNNNL